MAPAKPTAVGGERGGNHVVGDKKGGPAGSGCAGQEEGS